MGVISKGISNSFYLFMQWLSLTLFGYFFWIILGKFLTPTETGIYSTIFNLSIFIVGFSILGMHAASAKILPEYQVKNQIKKIKSTVFYTLKFTLIVNLILAFGLFLFSDYLSQFGYLTSLQFRLLSIFLLSTYFLYITGGYLYALQQMKRIFLTDSAITITKLILSVILIFLGFSYFGAVVGVVIATVTFSLLRFKWIPIGKGKPDSRKIWFYATHAFIGGIGGILINQANIIILSILSTMSSVGIFTIAFMFSTPIRIIPQTITSAILPITSQKWELKEKITLNKMIEQTLKYSYFFAIPIALIFIVFSREFIILFTSRQYLDAAIIFPTLSIAFLLIGVSTILFSVLYYTGKPKTQRNISLMAGFMNLILCILLIPFLDILGAALAFLVSGLIMFLTSFYYSYKHLKFSIGKRQLFKSLIASFLFIITLFIFRQIDSSIFTIIIAIVTASIIYLISLLYLRFFDEIDLKILREFKTKSPKRFKTLIIYVEKILEKFV